MTTIHAAIKSPVWQSDADEAVTYTLFYFDNPLGRFAYGTDNRGQAYFQSPKVCKDVATEAEAKAAVEAVHAELVLNLIGQHCEILPEPAEMGDDEITARLDGRIGMNMVNGVHRELVEVMREHKAQEGYDNVRKLVKALKGPAQTA